MANEHKQIAWGSSLGSANYSLGPEDRFLCIYSSVPAACQALSINFAGIGSSFPIRDDSLVWPSDDGQNELKPHKSSTGSGLLLLTREAAGSRAQSWLY